MKRIYIACGGSAGHIFPGLTLARELTRRYGNNIEISFFTSDNKLGQTLLGESGFNFHALPLRGLRRGSFSENLDFLSRLFRGSLESAKIIFLKKPDCFIGFGSYVAGPLFAAASLRRVPTLIHEQNAVMGRANRIMRHFATKIALSFPDEALSKKKNAVLTGNPIRELWDGPGDRKAAIESLGLDPHRFTILILGGSQGSRTINSAAINLLRNAEKELLDKIQVIHVSGESDYANLKDAYADIDISHKLFSFAKDMNTLYNATDVAVARAGASSIFELCARLIPSILIPYPFAEGHQLCNAGYLARRGAAVLLEEKDLTQEMLRSKVSELMEDEGLRNAMAEKMGEIVIPDAAKKLAYEVGLLAGLEPFAKK